MKSQITCSSSQHVQHNTRCMAEQLIIFSMAQLTNVWNICLIPCLKRFWQKKVLVTPWIKKIKSKTVWHVVFHAMLCTWQKSWHHYVISLVRSYKHNTFGFHQQIISMCSQSGWLWFHTYCDTFINLLSCEYCSMNNLFIPVVLALNLALSSSATHENNWTS